MVDIFQLAEIFAELVVEVEDLKLVEKAFVRLIWSCLNGRMYFLWPLSVMTVEEKMSNAGGHLSFWDGDVDRFLKIASWSSREGDRCENEGRGGDRIGCGGGLTKFRGAVGGGGSTNVVVADGVGGGGAGSSGFAVMSFG